MASLNQFAFVEDRLITDNILIVHESLHSLKFEKSVRGFGLALKLDMARPMIGLSRVFLKR